MELDITTPAFLFPAITILMLSYARKILVLASVIRQLSNQAQTKPDENLIKQIRNLHMNINLLKITQILGMSSIFNCFITIILLYSELFFWGNLFFVISLALMMTSILLAIVEAVISGNALKIELKKLEKK